ncbi:ABC transporter ATP-binding protein [Serratia fonticola]|uniref:ABC transporter ATP-binding protein n=1 Tax=Serratia fonticola TaxID=47917 RepID=UPI00217B7392|nr:ABC transporter ATP-binding protein [Serratia fonticola]CAI0877534.1 Putative multidrug export ATP-binding/permease protein SAV1866 [Serratia fonticola]CAI0911888.1 Putative multidrug export ATP-binding/permease protein SAV1866 [Serratia fonticola]
MYKKLKVNDWFANWIKPFDTIGTMPPNSAMRFTLYYLKRAKLPVFLMLLLSGLVAGIEAGMFYFIGRIIDMMNTSPQNLSALMKIYGTELLIMAIIIIFARTLFSWLLSLIQNLTFTLSFSMMVRWQAYTYVSKQGMEFFNNNHAGSVERKVWESGGAIGNLVSTLIQTLWFIIIYTLITLFLVGKTEPTIAVLLLVWIFIYGVISFLYVPKIRKYSIQHSDSGSKAKGIIVDNFSNIVTLKLFGSNGQGSNFVKNSLIEYYSDSKKLTSHISNATNLITLLSSFMIAMTTWFSFVSWSEGALTPGSVAFTLGLVLRLNSMLSGLLSQLNILMRHVGSLQSSVKLVAKPLAITDVHGATELKMSSGEIVFENVCFGYRPDKNILNNLTLKIKPGEKVAIVGPSGAGKTTIFNLLLRLYDPNAGRIIMDGQNISKVTQVSLHNSVVAVTQDGGLLHRSVRDNLILGREDISQSDIEKAVKLAKADEFIIELEDNKKRKGFDAFVGERGIKLSGGQRQRIAIARVLLKDASLYLFDEASSALDSESEAAIQQEILSKMKGKTVVMIAHRLSTVTSMDRLIVLRKGEIIEQGTHHQLLEMKGVYSRLWALQSGGYH